MSRATFIFAAVLAAVAGGLLWLRQSPSAPGSGLLPAIFMNPGERNINAFLALIREVEANGRYDVIAGGDTFDSWEEHPFVLKPTRSKPLGTTASGAYQQVRKTWSMARDALGLTDFTPESQDAAARWIIDHKIPGTDQFNLDGTGNGDAIRAGDFRTALEIFAPEWEAFDKILKGEYHVSLAEAESIFHQAGGGSFA